MSFDQRSNFGVTSITVAPSPAIDGTKATVKDATVFPEPPFNVTVAPALDALVTAKEQVNRENSEVWRVTARTGNELTVLREQEGSSARASVVGDQIYLGVTKRTLEELQEATESNGAAIVAETARAETAEALLAPKASPALTGTPTAPTAPALTDDTQLATTAYADSAVAVETARAKAAEKAEREAAEAASSQGLVPTVVKNAAYEAKPGDYIPIDISAGAVAITLPNAPVDKTRVGVKIVKGPATPGEHTLTIHCAGADVFNIAGGSTTLTLSARFQSVLLQYQHSTGIWYVQTTDTPLNEGLGAALLGSDGTVGGPGGLPTERLNPLGEVEGAVTPNWEEGNAVTATLKGATTFERPSHLPSIPGWMNVTLTQDASGHALKIGAGITMPGGEPVWSTAPLGVNQFSLWWDGLGNLWMFIGTEGKQGKEGPKGANGETVGSVEAALKMTYPAVNGNPKATATKAAVAWRMQRNMVVIPVKCKKLKILWTPGTVKGKVRVVVFDTGQKVAGKYSVLADTHAFVNPGVEKVSGILAELERKEGEWEAGEVVMIGLIPESAEMILPISTEPSVGASCKFPEGAIPHGVAFTKEAWISDQVVLVEATAKEETFAAIAEATPVAPAYNVAYAVLCA